MILAYQSTVYLAQYFHWITGLATAGIVYSILRQGVAFYLDGDDLGDTLKKCKKKIIAGIILLLISAIISRLKQYYVY